MNSATLVDITKNLKTSIGEKAIDREVLKTIAQSLTPEQKAQVAKNLEGTFLLKDGLESINMATGAYIASSPGGKYSYLTLCSSTESSNPNTCSIFLATPNSIDKGLIL